MRPGCIPRGAPGYHRGDLLMTVLAVPGHPMVLARGPEAETYRQMTPIAHARLHKLEPSITRCAQTSAAACAGARQTDRGARHPTRPPSVAVQVTTSQTSKEPTCVALPVR